jgi:O-antigen ligase
MTTRSLPAPADDRLHPYATATSHPDPTGVPDPRARPRTAERAAVLVLATTVACQPLLRPSGPGNSSLVDVFTLASLLSAAVWLGAAGTRLRAPYVLPFAGLLAGGLVAGMTGALPGIALLAVAQDLVLVVWLVAVVNVAARPGVAGLLVRVWAQAAPVAALVFVVASLLGITALQGLYANEGTREAFTFGDPNYAGTYFVVSIFVVHASSHPRHRLLRMAAYALLVWALVLTSSNGGFLELLIGTAFLTVLAVRRAHGLVPAAGLAALLAAVVVLALTVLPVSAIQTWARESGEPVLVNTIGRSNDSSDQRAQLISESVQLYRDSSGRGIGPGSTKPLLTARSYPYAKEAHDDYLASLVERGPLGALGLIALVLSAAVRCVRVVRLPRRTAGIARPAGLVAALLGMAVAASYYEVLHFRFLYLLLALVAVAAEHAVPRRPGPAPGVLDASGAPR